MEFENIMSRDLQQYLRPNGSPKQRLGKDDQIRIILEEMDFDKIHKVMVFLDWVWVKPILDEHDGTHKFISAVPTIDELKTESKKWLEDVWNIPEREDVAIYSIGSGGLVAMKCVYDGLKMLSLTFELTNWEFDYNDVQSENYE